MSDFSRRKFLKTWMAAGAAASVSLPDGKTTSQEAAVLGPDKVRTELTVNGKTHELFVEPRTTLLNSLRNQLDYTGTKEVCDRGACGACTVHIDGRPVVSCLTLTVDTAGKKVRTIEGLAKEGTLDALQKKFVEKEGLQCGFCIPGFLMSMRSTLDANPEADLETLKRGCAGNICRCAAYEGMFRAAVAVVKREPAEEDLYQLEGAALRKVLEERGVPRVDGPDKVTGRARYTYDVKLPGMLHMKVLHSPFPKASVVAEPNVAAAMAVPGVRHVEILTREVKRIGTEVAVILAEDPQAADEALSVLDVRFAPESVNVDVQATFANGEARPGRGRDAALEALADAKVKTDMTYHVQMVQHSPMEPHGVVIHPLAEGLDVYESTQGVWSVRGSMARAAGKGSGDINVICEHTGGGFGCKIGPWSFGPSVLSQAKKIGQPVKCMQSRAGQLLKGGGRVPSAARVQFAVDLLGKVDGVLMRTMGEAGPYWYSFKGTVTEGVRARIEGVGPTPALRGPGAPPAQFVMESAVEDLADVLRADPLEFRLAHVGPRVKEQMERWIEAAKPLIGWDRWKPAGSDHSPKPRGLGVGFGSFAGAAGGCFIDVQVDRETGVVKVNKVVAVLEGGFINRRGAINQVEGGTLMGLSWALFEERVLDGKTGAMLNTNHESYKILGAMDVPEMEVVLLGKPGSSRGIGEAPVVPVAGALGNAIFNALGVRVPGMPFTPRHVLAAISV